MLQNRRSVICFATAFFLLCQDEKSVWRVDRKVSGFHALPQELNPIE